MSEIMITEELLAINEKLTDMKSKVDRLIERIENYNRKMEAIELLRRDGYLVKLTKTF